MEKRSEVKYTFMGVILTAMTVLGVDVQMVLDVWRGSGVDPDTMMGFEEMAPMVRESTASGWQSIVAMWGGLAAYSWARTRHKESANSQDSKPTT